MPSETFFK